MISRLNSNFRCIPRQSKWPNLWTTEHFWLDNLFKRILQRTWNLMSKLFSRERVTLLQTGGVNAEVTRYACLLWLDGSRWRLRVENLTSLQCSVRKDNSPLPQQTHTYIYIYMHGFFTDCSDEVQLPKFVVQHPPTPPITEMENFQLMEPLILCWLIFMLVGMTLCNIFKTCSQTKISQQ